MTVRPIVLSVIAVIASADLGADVTITYRSESQSLQSMPMGIGAEAFRPTPQSTKSIRVKGAECLSSVGSLIFLTDLAKEEVQVSDSSRKIFATFPLAKYGEIIAALMPEPTPMAKAVTKMKATTSVRHTGRTETIQGIQAEEREIILSVETEIPTGVPQSGPLFRYVIHSWTAKPEEMSSVPGLRELARFSAVHSYFANPAEMLQKVASGFTGTAEGMDSIIEEFKKENSVVLRTVGEMYMPALGAMLEKLAAKRGEPITAGFDPNAPFMRMTQDVVEFSTTTLDDALFEIPADYANVSPEELMKGLSQARP
jgi:hypothetical protein